MATSKYVEKFKALAELGDGLCCRLHFLKHNLSSISTRPNCLTNQDWQKLRLRLEKTFPEIGDLSKVQGYDTFRQDSTQIADQLNAFGDILLDTIDFKNMAVPLMIEVPLEILELKLERNRSVIFMYLDLLVIYMRVMMLFSLIEERKTLVCLYNVSCSLMQTMSKPNVNDAVLLLTCLENAQRTFIDQFFSSSTFLGMILLQFRPSMDLAADCDNLRNSYVLNPMYDGDAMVQPSNRSVSAQCKLSIYNELMDADRYAEYILFSYLACPGLLFTTEHFELYKRTSSDFLGIKLFRDITISIHGEFDKLFTHYPTKKDAVAVPKGFKIRNEIKEVARIAAQTVGLRRKEKRAFLFAELANLNNMFTTLPGLLGPKFPQAMTAAAMARSELAHYFREQGADVRRDAGKAMAPEHYTAADITCLLSELCKLSKFVISYGTLVRKYYAEYLRWNDSDALNVLYNECISHIRMQGEPVALVLGAIKNDLAAIDTGNTDRAEGELEGFRLNCERLSIALASKAAAVVIKIPGIALLLQRVQEASMRSLLVDNLAVVLRDRFEPLDLWWFPAPLADAFRRALEQCNHQTRFPLAVMHVLSSSIQNVHTDCPEEQGRIGDASTKLSDSFLAEVKGSVEGFFIELWRYHMGLENQLLPVEAGRRVMRAYRNKQPPPSTTGNAAAQSSKELSSPPPDASDAAAEGNAEIHVPGKESQPWEHQAVLPLVVARAALVRLFTAAEKIGRLEVYDREYDLPLLMKQALEKAFEDKLQQTVSGVTLERSGFTLRKLLAFARSFQSVLPFIDFSFPDLMTRVLSRNFDDPGLPPEGVPIPLDYPAGTSLIWKIAASVLHVIERATARDSNQIWIMSQSSLARLRVQGGGVADQLIVKDDLVAMCMMVGMKGMRVIDFKLLSFIATKVLEMKDYLSSNDRILSNLFRDMFSGQLPGLRVQGAAAFMHSGIQAGMAIAIREALHVALGEVQGVACPQFATAANVTRQNIVSGLFPASVLTDKMMGLTNDAGPLGSIDFAFASVLNFARTKENTSLYSLLPEAFASLLLAADCWRTPYLPSLEAFAGNEHLLMLTLSRLLPTLLKPPKMEAEAMRFLQMSSTIILELRLKEGSAGNGSGGSGSGGSGSKDSAPPLRAMTLLPELFLNHSPFLHRSQLESVLPLALLHASQVDVAMGRQKYTDNVSPGFEL